jgi:uncharacterized protein
MPLLINLRQLERQSLKLTGELSTADLELESVDELIQFEAPLKYDLEAQKLDTNILIQGNLTLPLKCECARCLKPFTKDLELAGWVCHLSLEGDEKPVVSNDCVDLTPYIREDILLELPQRPLCKPECSGLPKRAGRAAKKTEKAGQTKEELSAWAELNKLKL